MPEKPETRFKRKIRPQLERLPFSWWVKVQQVAIAGTPDFLGCIRGKFVAIELKVGSGKLSKLQTYNLDRIFSARGLALVATPENWPKIYDSLKLLSEGKWE